MKSPGARQHSSLLVIGVSAGITACNLKLDPPFLFLAQSECVISVHHRTLSEQIFM